NPPRPPTAAPTATATRTATNTPVPPTASPTNTPTATVRPTVTPTASAAASGTPQGAAALQVDVLPSPVQPGGTARVVVSYVKDALVQVGVHLPQQHPFWLSDTTDSHGHLTLAIKVPRHVPLRHGHAVVSLD